MNTTGPCRALIARGMLSAIVLATDNAGLKLEIENTPTDDADDLLGVGWVPDTPGLYLFAGAGKWTEPAYSWVGDADPVLEWTGTIRLATPEELPALWAMEPQEEKL